MSNHFHSVVTGREAGAVGRLLQQVTGNIAQDLHGRLNRRGLLWQSRSISCVLDAHHFLSALANVDLNPVWARMVDADGELRGGIGVVLGRGTLRHCRNGAGMARVRGAA